MPSSRKVREEDIKFAKETSRVVLPWVREEMGVGESLGGSLFQKEAPSVVENQSFPPEYWLRKDLGDELIQTGLGKVEAQEGH